MLAGVFVMFSMLLIDVGESALPVRQESGEIQQCVEWIKSRSQRAPLNTGAIKIMSPQTACFDGELFDWTTKELSSWLNREGNGAKPTNFVVRSTGGDAKTGISIAKSLQRYGTIVSIFDYCMSSCANYIFAGVARRRLIDRPAILFHGGFSLEGRLRFKKNLERDITNPVILKHVKDVDAWKRKQVDYYDVGLTNQGMLYKAIHVNEWIATGTDGIDLLAIPVSQCGKPLDAKRDMLFFNKDQLRRLGVLIESGKLASSSDEISKRLTLLGISSIACAVPDNFLPKEV